MPPCPRFCAESHGSSHEAIILYVTVDWFMIMERRIRIPKQMHMSNKQMSLLLWVWINWWWVYLKSHCKPWSITTIVRLLPFFQWQNWWDTLLNSGMMGLTNEIPLVSWNYWNSLQNNQANRNKVSHKVSCCKMCNFIYLTCFSLAQVLIILVPWLVFTQMCHSIYRNLFSKWFSKITFLTSQNL